MNLQNMLTKIKEKFCNTQDLVTREFETEAGNKIAIVFLDNVVDQLLLSSSVIAPLQVLKSEGQEDLAVLAKNNIIAFSQVQEIKDESELVENILNGFCAILFEDSQKILVVQCVKWISRLPSEPPTSAVVKGPREGFVEDIVTNLTLLRKRLKTPNLKVENLKIGTETNSEVRIVYLDGVADRNVVEKIRTRLKNIHIDGVVDSNYLVEFLQADKHAFFKQVGSTEKPDIATAKILEGRVAILVDGSPIVLTLPYVLIEDLQASNDYYTNPGRATFLRYLRLIAAVIAITLPGIYVALLCHHMKAIPIKLLVTITNSIQGIPLTPLLETLFIIFLFEILYEASLRMPRYMGLALSVVGALILGDTAVQAGLISPPAVLIVAITGVMSYTLPEQSNQISFLRLIITIIGGLLGIFGVVLAVLFVIAYLSNMDSYGAPYLSPFAPNIPEDKKDALFRRSFKQMKTRPKSFPNENKRRIDDEGSK